MDKSDRVRLQHMLDAAREAIQFVNGRQEFDLATDRMPLLSPVKEPVKEIEIIGKAASQISRAEQGRANEIPWARIVSMPNRLIHAYADVNIGLVWNTVATDLPVLVAQLEALLAEHQ